MRIAKVQFLKRPKGLQFGSPPFRAWFYSWLTDTDTGCQEWRGSRRNSGYGQIHTNGKTMQSHRVAWQLVNGDIPAGNVVRHKCHNKACCNVKHLELGSQAENVRDRVESGRNRDAHDMSQTKPIKIQEQRKRNMKFGSADFVAWFWNQTKRMPNGCLEWQKARDRTGYGVITIGSKSCLTHRIAWCLWHGDIPEGLIVMHTCDNRICVDIHHLRLGTQADNMRDRDSKGRQPKGESQGSAKLTEADVRDIRRIYATGDYSQRKIAKAYCVGHPAIHSIVNRKTWKHVD